MHSSKNKKGSALFIVLGCVALMTLLVVAFLGSTISERITSNSYAREINSKLLAENAINLVMSQLRTATKAKNPTGSVVSWASQPGMIRTYGIDGNPDHYFKLYSWSGMVGSGQYPPSTGVADAPDVNWATETDLYTDINEAVNSHNPIISAVDANGNPLKTMTTAGHTSVLTYATTTGTADIEGFYVDPATTPTGGTNQVPMPVMWIYILKDGTQVIPTINNAGGVNVTGATVANPVVGRISFWTDDECSKVNINTASEGAFWDVPTTWAIEDMGAYSTSNSGAPILPTGLGSAVPAGGEYQRVPGHPATTSLSTIFGSILPLPTPPYTGTTYDSYIAPYYTLTPRYAPGGTKFGTRPSFDSTNTLGTYDSAGGGGFLVPPTYRLYASADEVMFDPSRVPDTLANSSVYVDSGANGISPSTRPAIPGMTQNFLNEIQFFLTANSKAPEETLFETPRISLWPESTDTTNARNVKDNLLAFCSTINHYPYYFQRGSAFQTQKKPAASGSFGSIFNTALGSISGSSQDPAYDMGGTTTGKTIAPYGMPDASTPYNDTVTAGNTNIKRNQNLLAYLQAETKAAIPGFGAGTFLTKYPIPTGSTTNISDIDQILVDMFDYIRSNVNTVSLAYDPKYTYTPMSTTGGTGSGAGTSIPIQVKMTSGGNVVSGLGRSTTIAELSIVFIATGYKDTTAFGTDPLTTPPYLPTPATHMVAGLPVPGDGIPDDVADSSGNYDRIGDPQTQAMQAFIVLRPFNYTPGTTAQNPNYRYAISGLDSMYVNFSGGSNPIPGAPNSAYPMGFPSAGSAVDLMSSAVTTGYNALTEPSAANYYSRSASSIYMSLFAPIGSNNPQGGYARLPGNSDGNLASVKNGSNIIYPWVSGNIPMPTISGSTSAANPSRFGGQAGTTDLRPNLKPNTFSFGSGSDIKITVMSGFQNNTSEAPVLQTITIPASILNIDSLPIPSFARANTDSWRGEDMADNNLNTTPGTWTPLGGTTISQTPPGSSGQQTSPLPYLSTATGTQNQLSWEFYTQTSWFPGNVASRLNLCTVTGSFAGYAGDAGLIQRGDTVRSLVLNPKSNIHGDIRVVANLTNVPANMPGDSEPVYTWLGTNRSTSSSGTMIYDVGAFKTADMTQLHSLYYDSGNFYSYSKHFNSTVSTTGTHASGFVIPPTLWVYDSGNNDGQGLTGGVLVSGPTGTINYYNNLAPCVTPELLGAYMDKTNTLGYGGSNITLGDWTNGLGSEQDGPMISTPDEGYQAAGGSLYNSPYYMTFGGVVIGQNAATAMQSYSPNRQIASPVMFGTLPAGVQAGQGWRTLLFCPNPEAKSLHPGFGVGSGAGTGPNYIEPYTTSPPDHLLLDLFWMPVVDPYAISEPFATMGKVNMNYQIQPFTYIHRSTAVRAVLKSAGVMALPNTASLADGVTGKPQYKSVRMHYNIVEDYTGMNANYRYNVNLDETIDAADSGFQQRFANGDIFRSASEICNIFLVPQLIPGNTYTTAGAAVPATYTATQDWWDKFQLTGDNNRESPYNQIYPRLTTKSNTFQVNYRVQTLVKNSAKDPAIFNTSTTGGDSIGGEYRGSATIERYIDPNDTSLPDFATAYTNNGTTMSDYYRFRVVRSKSFNP